MKKNFPLALFGGSIGSGAFAAWYGDQFVVRVCMALAVIAVVWFGFLMRATRKQSPNNQI